MDQINAVTFLLLSQDLHNW